MNPNLKILAVKVDHKPDELDLNHIGIIAKAEIWNPVSQVTQVIRSGGLWGIESDGNREYLESLAKEELAQLKTELLALGIGGRAIDRAFSKLG